MKAFLMYPDRDFDLQQELPPNAEDLIKDLELNVLFTAMAQGDHFLFDLARQVILSSLTDPDIIVYRQRVLADCLQQPAVVKDMYELAVAAIEGERKGFFYVFRDSPDSVLARSVRVLEFFAQIFSRLRVIADEQADNFESAGFTRFFQMLTKELDDEYLRIVDEHLKELKFRRGVLISAHLGRGNKGRNYTLRRQHERGWKSRLAIGNRSSFGFQIPDRDQAGYSALADLRNRGLNTVANALAQSTDHILSFFKMLRAELGFYIGCLNLHQLLTAKGEPTCFPIPLSDGERAFTVQGLYDAGLTLTADTKTVGNDVSADGKLIVMITGANQGGKSTFLRSVGQGDLMMQSGMFAPAQSFRADVATGIFTHYKREEDATMESGKLDEELRRMSTIADTISTHGLLLCNESFASTNEREGSEIGRQVIRALVDADVKIFFVTHLFDLASRIHGQEDRVIHFLRAERRPDGTRTFKLREGEPLSTSYGEDAYRRVFGGNRDSASARL